SIRVLVKNFSLSVFESNKQVFIIRDADKMHANAANSLLKVIEEPQSAIHIFLLTNQEDAVLPTIKSRTQIIGFPKYIPAMERLLEEEGV
ncbi:DNA polymerase III subunit delta', partial [Streptococcus suis]